MAKATPYASCLTNTGTSIVFRLNEAADNVKLVYNSDTVTNDLGGASEALIASSGNVESITSEASHAATASSETAGIAAAATEELTNSTARIAQQAHASKKTWVRSLSRLPNSFDSSSLGGGFRNAVPPPGGR